MPPWGAPQTTMAARPRLRSRPPAVRLDTCACDESIALHGLDEPRPGPDRREGTHVSEAPPSACLCLLGARRSRNRVADARGERWGELAHDRPRPGRQPQPA